MIICMELTSNGRDLDLSRKVDPVLWLEDSSYRIDILKEMKHLLVQMAAEMLEPKVTVLDVDTLPHRPGFVPFRKPWPWEISKGTFDLEVHQ